MRRLAVQIVIVGLAEAAVAAAATWAFSAAVDDERVRDFAIIGAWFVAVAAGTVLLAIRWWPSRQPVDDADAPPDEPPAPTDREPTLTEVQQHWHQVYSQPQITDQVVYLVDICKWMRQDVIVGKTFVRCIIEGPVVAILDNVAFQRPLFEADTSIDQIFWTANEQRIDGVISISHCLFVDCRFRAVGMLVSDDEQRAELKRLYGDWSDAPYHPLFDAGGVKPVVPPRGSKE